MLTSSELRENMVRSRNEQSPHCMGHQKGARETYDLRQDHNPQKAKVTKLQ